MRVQKCVYQKWPHKTGPVVHFVASHDGPWAVPGDVPGTNPYKYTQCRTQTPPPECSAALPPFPRPLFSLISPPFPLFPPRTPFSPFPPNFPKFSPISPILALVHDEIWVQPGPALVWGAGGGGLGGGDLPWSSTGLIPPRECPCTAAIRTTDQCLSEILSSAESSKNDIHKRPLHTLETR